MLYNTPVFAKETDCGPANWDDFPWSVDVPDGQHKQGIPRQVTITDREVEPLVPAEKMCCHGNITNALFQILGF